MMKRVILSVALVAVAGCSNVMGESGREAAARLAAQDAAVETGGQPGIATETITSETISFFQSEVGDRVLFVVDQAALTNEAILILDAQAAWLNANPAMSAIIEGHADEQGTRDYNIGLGDRRATAVYNYLVSRGISARRLSTVSFGKERPLELCSEEACWAKNRRAVTVVAGGLTG